MTDTCVVIPTYLPELGPFEEVSVSKYTQFLAGYDTFLVTYPGNELEIGNISKVTFDKKFFSYRGQNRLRLQSEFFKPFQKYEYMLLYELDALILSNDLDRFIELELDFIGAPIFYKDAFKLNSGFSLRNVQKCLEILNSDKIKGVNDIYTRNEDTFWSWTVPNIFDFKIANMRQSLSFSFNNHPRLCYLLNKHLLPLGCHGWHKWDVDFWVDKI